MRNSIFAVLFGFAALAAIPAYANTGTFNFAGSSNNENNAYGDSLSYTATGISGLTVTVTGWSTPNVSSGTDFVKAAVDNYSGTNLGLGVCSANDPSGAGCSSPYHQVDNSRASGTPAANDPDEFIVFKFSTAVNLSGIDVANYLSIAGDTNVDLTYYTASTALTTGTTLGSLGTGTTLTGNPGSGNAEDYTLSGTDVTYLIIAASVPDAAAGNIIDSFKVNSLSVNNNVVSATPEPATFAMLGSALIGLGFIARKRKRV